MTTSEYYDLLREKHASTDWSNLNSIREYNEYARSLRHSLNSERDLRAGTSAVSFYHRQRNAHTSDSRAK